jgi:hypothetical protein
VNLRLRDHDPPLPQRAVLAHLAVALCLGVHARATHADADESSLHVHAIGGAARLGEDGASGPATVPLVGLGARFTYAFSNLYAWEAAGAFASSTAAHYADFPDPDGGPSGELVRSYGLRIADP